jgi:hypothetical protein
MCYTALKKGCSESYFVLTFEFAIIIDLIIVAAAVVVVVVFVVTT